jgi:hypothetical protein
MESAWAIKLPAIKATGLEGTRMSSQPKHQQSRMGQGDYRRREER